MGNTTGKSESTVEEKSQIYPIDPQLKEKAYALEKEFIDKYCSPLTSKEMHYKDVPINYLGETYIHTLIRGEEDLLKPNHNGKKILIMIHGYQASSFMFYKMVPLISDKFIVICPDMIGMGFSSRPKVQFTTCEQTIDIFVESIEKLRQSLNIEKFYICGHSLGGYFSLNYALKYPQYLEDNIFLMSPSGVGDPAKGGSCTENLNFSKKVSYVGTMGLLFYLQPTLQNLSKKYIIGNSIFNRESNKFTISKEENELIGKIRAMHFEYPPDLDACSFYIYKHPIPTPIKPLEDLICQQIPEKNFIFAFGETDWMDKFGAERLNKKDGNKYKYFNIPKVGHRWPMDKAEEGAKLINEYL